LLKDKTPGYWSLSIFGITCKIGVMIKTKPIWKSGDLSLQHLVIFVACFAVVGCFLIWKSFAATPADADLNKDGVVNITDLSILISSYSTTNTTADINKDGIVNIIDLSILLSNYNATVTTVNPTGHFWQNSDTATAFNFTTDSLKMDYFVAHAFDSTSMADSYHQKNATGKALFYVDFGVAGDPCCVASVLDTNTVNANSWWATHNGVKIPNPWGGPSWLVDLGKPGVANAYIASLETKYGTANGRWQGVFADDVNSWRNLGYVIDGYSSYSDWINRAEAPLLNKVTAAITADKGGIIIPNIGNWPQEPDLNVYSANSSGGLTEWFMTWANGAPQAISEIENEYSSIRDAIAKNHLYFGITHSTTLTKYSFCAAAIMGEPGKIFITNQTDYGTSPLVWDATFDLNIGTSTQATQHTTGSNIWSRQFTNKKLTIDTNAQSCTIQ
jgi:hypothetical protein